MQGQLFLNTYCKLLERPFLLIDEPALLIVILPQVAKSGGDFFLFFVAGLPGWDEIVRLEQSALLCVGCSDVQAVLIEHDSLAFHLRRFFL